MTQRPQAPEIGSFRMTNEPIPVAPTPTTPSFPIDPEVTRVFSSNEGTDAVRRFLDSGRSSGSMVDPHQFAASELPDPPAQHNPENLAAQIDDLQKTAASLEKSPENTYLDRLKKHSITVDRAREIIDCILFKGEYQETYPVTQRQAVTFKSRMFSDQERALKSLEALSPQYPATMAAVVSKNNLASSLVRFAGKDFSKMAFKDKAEFIERLPEPLVRLLAIKLGKFDQMIMDIMDDGVIENF